MIRLKLGLFLIASLLQAEIIKLDPGGLDRDLEGLGHYQIEEKERLDAQKIRDAESLERLRRSNFGYDQRRYWVRYRFENSGDRPLSAVLYNPRPGMQHIDVHLFGPTGYSHHQMGALHPPQGRSFQSIYSNIRLDLAPKEQIDVVIAMQTYGAMEAIWQLKSLEGFYALESQRLIVLVTFAIFLLTLVFKNLLLYSSVRESLYLFYSLFLIANVLLNSAIGGLAYRLLAHSELTLLINSMSWVMAVATPSLVWIFTYLFFRRSGRSRLLFWLTAAVVSVNMIFLLLFIYAFVFDMSLLKSTALIILAGYLESLLLALVAAVMYFKKRPGSGYFLLAHIFYVASIVSFLMLIDGHLRQSVWVSHLPLFGTMVTVLLMSIALSARLRSLRSENEQLRHQIARNEQLVAIGSSIFYVVHQWKQPLSALSALLMRLLHLLEKRPSASLAEVAPTIERMEDRIGEMNESMDAARRFFSQRLEYGGHFRLSEIIERIRTAQAERLKLTGVQLQVRGDIDLMITGSDNLFFNAVNNLVGNAVDALSSSDRSDRVIMISAFKEPGGFKMTLEDNAHGIDPAVLDRLFEPFVTTKDDGSGIGLMLAKNILEEYFGATIAVKSDRNGTGFTMEFDD